MNNHEARNYYYAIKLLQEVREKSVPERTKIRERLTKMFANNTEMLNLLDVIFDLA